MKKVLCNGCKKEISAVNISRHKCVANYNWDEIQKKYDAGMSFNELAKEYNTDRYIFGVASKEKLLKVRNSSDAAKMAQKLKKVDCKEWWTPERKKQRSEEKKAFFKEHPEKHPNRILANNRKKMSYPERLVYDYLIDEKIPFIHNAPVLEFFVDFLVGDKIIEVDGERWHDVDKDKIRDCKIKNAFNINIIRLPAKVINEKGGSIVRNIINDKSTGMSEEVLNIIKEIKNAKVLKRQLEKTEYNLICQSCKNYFTTVNKYRMFCSNECKGASNRKVDRPSAQQLQTDIENLPVTGIGKKYGVSDAAIRKWCISYGISFKKELYPPKHLLEEDLKNDLPFLQIAKKYNTNNSTIKLRIKQHGLVLPKRQSNKLTELQVKEIKQKLSQGACNKELAQEYGVASNTISQIRTGVSWTSVK